LRLYLLERLHLEVIAFKKIELSDEWRVCHRNRMGSKECIVKSKDLSTGAGMRIHKAGGLVGPSDPCTRPKNVE
jgi:hypothetical protein